MQLIFSRDGFRLKTFMLFACWKDSLIRNSTERVIDVMKKDWGTALDGVMVWWFRRFDFSSKVYFRREREHNPSSHQSNQGNFQSKKLDLFPVDYYTFFKASDPWLIPTNSSSRHMTSFAALNHEIFIFTFPKKKFLFDFCYQKPILFVIIYWAWLIVRNGKVLSAKLHPTGAEKIRSKRSENK